MHAFKSASTSKSEAAEAGADSSALMGMVIPVKCGPGGVCVPITGIIMIMSHTIIITGIIMVFYFILTANFDLTKKTKSNVAS